MVIFESLLSRHFAQGGKVNVKSLFGHFNDLGVLASVGASADHKIIVICCDMGNLDGCKRALDIGF